MHTLLSVSRRPRPCLLPRPTLVFSRARSGARKPSKLKAHAKPQPLKSVDQRRAPFKSADQRRAEWAVVETKPVMLKPTQPVAEGKTLAPEDLQAHLSQFLDAWQKAPQLVMRLRTYGVEANDVPRLVTAFAEAVRSRPIFDQLNYTHEQIARIAQDVSSASLGKEVDVSLTRLLYEWASHSENQAVLSQRGVSDSTLASISSLFRAADMSDPSSVFPRTRQWHRRKFIMHIGPTNSGKTYNALRALAAAKYGLYAGPLRLLAHEIFERLNKGQIVPLGEDPAPDAEPDEDVNLDAVPKGEKPAIQKQGNKKYARACNLITGEQQVTVEDGAGLVSCTVEMTPTGFMEFDVAVIDEIQMIADETRGYAWTTAVLGVNAKEVHLCGEETALPVIEAMLRDTGDELIVNRYERLSPLRVADESLKGDFAQVKKGDCIVSFSRSGIFRIKERVEKATGMKCAVAYGMLPPEIRTEQAALFNKPGSGYDVMIGSDAIGMGLNLKIKRIIFESTQKWNGKQLERLNLSSMKQIAGRAGRFGLHEDDSAGGVVTTLFDEDLPIIREAVAAPYQPLKYARVAPLPEQFESVLQALPPGVPLATAQTAFEYVAKMHPAYELESSHVTVLSFNALDRLAPELTLGDRHLMKFAPIGWRDVNILEWIRPMLGMFAQDMLVDYRRLFRITGMQNIIDEAKELMESGATYLPPGLLVNLESVHKMIILYIWLSYRNPVTFSQREEITVVKDEVEKYLEWALDASATQSGSRTRRPSVSPPQHSWEGPFDDDNDLAPSGGSPPPPSRRQQGNLGAASGVVNHNRLARRSVNQPHPQ